MKMKEIDNLIKQSGPMPETDNLVALLRWRAQHQPDKLAYTFLLDGEDAAAVLTYSQLDQAAIKYKQRRSCSDFAPARSGLYCRVYGVFVCWGDCCAGLPTAHQ